MHSEKVISPVESFVKDDMAWICNAHDRYHINRVRLLANKIAEHYPSVDNTVVEAGALLHEYFDDKFFSEEQLAKRKTSLPNFLRTLWFSEQQVVHIIFIVDNVWFGKSMERDPHQKLTIEFQIVEDADRLESIGAIAIARTFSYWWKKWRQVYDPQDAPQQITNKQIYRQWSWSSINHFYEKLLLLKDLLHTQVAKDIAQKRHAFMELYLQQFFDERNVIV